MTRRERALCSTLLAIAAAAAWSAHGFRWGAAPRELSAAAAGVVQPCPPGFLPHAEVRRLPELSPGELRPAAPFAGEECVLLVRQGDG